MFNINSYFDKIYILNLEEHSSKWNNLKVKMDLIGITNYIRFKATNGYVEPHLSEWKEYCKKPYDDKEKKLGRKKIGSPGVLGNLKSLIEILKDAKKNNYKKILFMEDDVIFHKQFNTVYTQKMNFIPNDWKLLYFGSNDSYYTKRNNITYKNFYYADKHTSGGFSVGINSSVFDELINISLQKTNPFDSGSLSYIIEKYPKKCIVITPNIIICDVSNSSLRNKRDMDIFSKSVGWNLHLFDYK